jgi:hypothetical protein
MEQRVHVIIIDCSYQQAHREVLEQQKKSFSKKENALKVKEHSSYLIFVEGV